VIGADKCGRERFASYGSATCDGLRALIRCGLQRDDPRMLAAFGWLRRNFTVVENPGTFARDRETLRNSYFYYYCWSLAHAMQALGVREIETPAGLVSWPRVLSKELLRRQQREGSWVNEYSDAKEDDPLVATPFAIAALIICREL